MGNGDVTRVTKETQPSHQGLPHLSESPEKSGPPNAIREDSLSADGEGSMTPPIVQEGCWARLTSYLRGLFNKLLSFFGKKIKVVPTGAPQDLDLQLQSELLQENKWKEYLLRRHGVEESAGAAMVDKLGSQGSKPTVSIDDSLEEVYALWKKSWTRHHRWDKTPSRGPKAAVDGLRQLKDSKKVNRAIEVEIAAVREETSVVGSILAGREAEASQRLRIVEVLHELAERYRAAISDPNMARIFLLGFRRYTDMRDRWLELHRALIKWDVERRTKIAKETIEAAKRAKRETKIEGTEASRP